MASCCRLLECAFGSKPCFIPCARNTRESTASRLMYSIILLLTVLLSLASHDGGLMGIIFDEYKEQILSICDDINGGPNCMRFRGFVGIYRLCLPLFAFHFTMTFVTIKVSSSQTFRGRIHNGFWLWKICFLLFMYIMAYTFPFLEDYTKSVYIFNRLFLVWMVLGIFGALIFIYIQHITLIDFSYEVNEIWYAKSFQTRWFTFSIYLCSVLLYIGTAAAYSLLLLFYGLPHGCSLNLTLTGINFGLTTLSAICSVFSDPLRRRHLWLPGAVTSAFVAFLTWSALSSQPKTISSDVPWHGFPGRPRNITVHPILVVADQLNRLLSDSSFTRKPSVTSNLPTLRRNDCVPGGISSTGEHLGKDLITVCTLVLVIGGSVYSSFRASMEARRLGIRTRREKIKRLLAAIPEQRELDFQTSPIRLPVSKKGKDISGPLPPPFFDHKEVVRQEEALNKLAAIVAELPHPKIFRRPSARQPQLQQPHAIRGPTGSNDKVTGDMNRRNDTKCSPQPSAPSLVDGNKQTLRVSSSVPDLTVTLRQLSKRTDIRDFDWNTGTSNGDVTLHTKGRRKSEKESVEREQLERVFRQLHSVQKRPPKKRADTKRIPARTPKRTALLPISDNEEVVAELSQLSPDSLPDKVGNNLLSSNGCPGKRSTSILHDGQNAALLPIKRSSRAGSGHGRRATSLSDSDADAVSLCEPGHLRYRMARCASDLMISRKASRFLEMNPNLLTSFSFIGPMLSTAAPRDGFTMYNEVIAPMYSYAWFHFIYALATLYVMAQLTNWYNPQSSGVDSLSGSWANMWMKLASSWIAILLYSWTVICPRFCVGRKLGDTPFTPRTPQATIAATSPV